MSLADLGLIGNCQLAALVDLDFVPLYRIDAKTDLDDVGVIHAAFAAAPRWSEFGS